MHVCLFCVSGRLFWCCCRDVGLVTLSAASHTTIHPSSQPLSAAAGASLDLEADAITSSSSSTAGSEADAVQQYKRRRLEVLELAPTVFADTDEQYASLTAVKARLEGFKAQYPREYSQVGWGGVPRARQGLQG